MKKRALGRRVYAFVLAGALLALAAGLAYGAIPGADGTITACVDSKGLPKLIDAEAGTTCGAGKQTLTWNQQGPAGPQGAQGPPGPQGAEGPAGPSDAYFTHQGTNSIKLNPDAGPQTILSLELPAGHHLVWATVSIFAYGSGEEPEFTSCTLEGGTVSIESDTVWTRWGEWTGKAVLISPVTLVRQDYVKVVCTSTADPLVAAKISALRVGSLTEK